MLETTRPRAARPLQAPHFPTLGTFLAPESDLQPLRADLYRSDAPGYVILPGFLEPEYLSHMQEFWLESPPPDSAYAPWVKQQAFPIGHPAMLARNRRRTMCLHFLWNAHHDPVTIAIALAITHLRNLIEGRPPHRHLIPDGSAMTTYRVVVSKNSKNEVEVPPHADTYTGDDDALARLQATLFLTEHGKDWAGEGLVFTTNSGDEIPLGRDRGIQPGDLVLWQYNNIHCVRNVHPVAGGRGFARMIFPADRVAQPTA